MEVYAKYVDTNPANWTTALNTLITQIAANTAGVVVDGASYSTSTSSFPFPGVLSTAGSTGGPKAYLNWIFFDKNYTFVPAQSGYKRMTTAAREYGQDVAHERLFGAVTAAQSGYMYIYLSNEETAPVEVYFDDFKVEQTKLPVIQANDYYPFGLTFNSYSRENATPNDYKYNGKELQDELSLGWLDYGARMNMPDIGRWGVIDPYSSKFEIVTPYNYAFNNPLLFVDPNGKENIIYLLTAGNFSKTQARDVMNKANEMFKKLGIETRVSLYDSKKNGKFSEGKLAKTDNWVVLGTDRKEIAKMSKEISSDSKYDQDVDLWVNDDGRSPEVSNNNINGKGISVDYDDALKGRDLSEQSALWMIHGAGHSAGPVIENGGHLKQGVMQRGGSTLTSGLTKDYYDGGINRVLAPNPLPNLYPGNETYIRGMMERYGTKKAEDKYPNN